MNLDEFEVAVLMTVYKRDCPARLHKALTGLEKQSIKKFNIYIVVDGEIPLVLEKIIHNFRNVLKIKIFPLKDNIGAGPARNYGITKIKEKYIAIHDSDDVSHPARIQKQLDYIKKVKADLIGSNMNIIDEDNNIIGTKYVLSATFLREHFFYKCEINNPTAFFNREKLKGLGYGNSSKSEDYILWVRCAVNNLKIINLEDRLVDYYMPKSSYSKRIGKEYFFGDLRSRMLGLKMFSIHKRIVLFPVAIILSSIRLLPSYLFHKIYKLKERFFR